MTVPRGNGILHTELAVAEVRYVSLLHLILLSHDTCLYVYN